MKKIIFGYEKFKDDGDPIDNCIDYVFNDWKIADCGNIFLAMLQRIKYDYIQTSKREWENLLVDTKQIDDIKGYYYYVINIREFSAALGIDRLTGDKLTHNNKPLSIFDYISGKVLNHVREGRCKIILNYGYEGLGSKHNDSILSKKCLERLHSILEHLGLSRKSIIYLDSNVTLENQIIDTTIKYYFYEYTALDWERFSIMHPKMTYHGNTISQKNMKLWKDSQSKLRKKYFLSFNRLPKQHRVDLVLTLEKYGALDKGYVSFPTQEDFWKFETYNGELKPYENSLFSKLPLKIDKVKLNEKKWSYEKFDNKFYLDSYFQIIADNHFDSYKDQVHLTEKVWKAITNFQPFIYIGHPTALKKLKEFGFKTFEPFIDESYDDEYDKDKRFKMIQEQISRLVCDKTIEEIHEWYWSIEKTLRHNYFHFYGKWINEHRNNLLNKISIPFHLPSEQFLFKPESEHDGEFNQPIKNCDYLRHLIWCKGGQYFIYHDSNHNSGTNNQTNETWKTRYDKEFIEGREFYIIGSGNDGDYSDVLLYDIDEIYKFFEERNVEKKKIIFLTSNNDLNLGLKTFTESIKNGGVFEPINITDWNKYNKITNIITKKIESEIPYCPYIFNVGDHPLNYSDLVITSNKNNQPSKLFSTTMWTQKVPYDIIFDKIRKSGLIKKDNEIHEDDIGWVSYPYGTKWDGDKIEILNRRFEEDGESENWKDNCYDVLKDKISDSFISVMAESNIDFTIFDDTWESKHFLKSQQYYRSIMTSTYLTEKSMWSIYLKKPFFIIGGIGILDALKGYGFKTFDRIFDESYQYETDLYKRVDIIFDQISELSKKSNDEIVDMVNSVQDIVDYNQKLLLSTARNSLNNNAIKKYLYKNIEDVLK